VAWLQTAVGRLERPHATESAQSPIPSLAALRTGACLGLLPCSSVALRDLELSAVSKHGMHDDGKPPRESTFERVERSQFLDA
jgi:hypothetical protein